MQATTEGSGRGGSGKSWSGLVVRLGILIAAVYSFPYFPRLRSAMEMPRLFQTVEMFEHRTFALDASLLKLQGGSMIDVVRATNGHLYPNKAPGSSLLAIPGYAALRAFCAILHPGAGPQLSEIMWVCRFTTATVPFLAAALLMWALLRRFASRPVAFAALMATTFGSMMFPTSLLLFSSVGAAASILGAFYLLASKNLREAHVLGAGALCGLAILFDYESVLGIAVVAAMAYYRATRKWRSCLWFVVALAPSIAFLCFYHWKCFGGPFRTGYSELSPEQRPVLLKGPNEAALYDVLLSPSNGLFTLMPWTLAALVGGGLGLCSRKHGRLRELLVPGIVLAVGVILFTGSISKDLAPRVHIGGWSVGPRYMMIGVPFLGLLFAQVLARARRIPEFFGGLVGLSLVGGTTMVTGATLFPHWPESVMNPLYDCSFPLLRANLVPPNVGYWLFGHGFAALIPLYILLGALFMVPLISAYSAKMGPAPRWARLRALTACAVTAASIVWAYGFLPRGSPDIAAWVATL
jgi:hypothetical protein